MAELLDKIIEAKEKIGDDAAKRIAEFYHVENYDEVAMKGCCPFHHEDTPSFIWDKKDKAFKCFGCQKRASILDVYIQETGSYLNGVKKLLEEAGIKYNSFSLLEVSEDKKHFFANYKWPKEEVHAPFGDALNYIKTRGISDKTIEYLDIRASNSGREIAFQVRDVEGRIVGVKYRPARRVKDGPKFWWQQNASTCPALYNEEKIDTTQPLLVVEGFFDCLACVEAGYKNVVSIPGGAEDCNWIDFNYEWLDQFEQIILWYDNDQAGQTGIKEATSRLGEYRCKIASPTTDNEDAVEAYYKQFKKSSSIRKTDANNILLAQGPDAVLSIINNAKEIPLESVVDVMDCEPFDIEKTYYIPSSLSTFDKHVYGFIAGTTNVWTAQAGCVDCDTEFFNGVEWKRISEYEDGDAVLIYYPDGKAGLVYPSAYHKIPCEYLGLLKTDSGVNQCLSEEHNVYYVTRKRKELKHKRFSDLKYEIDTLGYFDGELITAYRYSGLGTGLSELELSNDIYACLTRKEELPDNIFYSNDEEFKIIFNIIKNTFQNDGYTFRFFVYNKKDADILQFLFSAHNLTTIVDEQPSIIHGRVYRITIKTGKYTRLKNRSKEPVRVRKYKSKDGFKYCFTVPTHMWIMRRNGRVCVTGNCGKSTLLTQSCVLEAVEHNESVFWFNAESTPAQSSNWLISQAAGRFHTIEKTSPKGFKYYQVTKLAQAAIREYYQGKIFIYDNLLMSSAYDVLDAMKYMYKKRGTKIFIIDNWLCLSFKGHTDSERTTEQVKFMTELIHFTKKNGVILQMVCHPKKLPPGVPMDEYSLLGTSNITNLVDRIYGLEHPNDRRLLESGEPYDRQLSIFKDRVLGTKGQVIGLKYDKTTRRLYTNDAEKFRRYSWEKEYPINYRGTAIEKDIVGSRILEHEIAESPF